MDRDSIEKLSRQIPEKSMENALTSVEKRSPRVSIDKNLLRICQEAVEIKENEFFKEMKKIQSTC